MLRTLAAAALLAGPGCGRSSGAPPAGAAAPSGREPRIAFARDGHEVGAASLSELTAAAPPERLTVFDPYYNRTKTFLAVPLAAVLRVGFGPGAADLAHEQFVLRSRDGYTVPVSGEKLVGGGAYLAFRDEDVPGWEPIGAQRANPGPFYLVWRRAEQLDLEAFPRPYQLAVIEVARFESVFPHTFPAGVPEGDPALRGFALFRDACVRCHAINREGGRVGPDLNVPMNVTEYRPEEQIRAYVRNPLTFRYSTMPAHPGFSAADLDALVAYLRAMRGRKFDPAADAGAPAPAPPRAP